MPRLLSVPLIFAASLAAVALAGCDRESAPQAQQSQAGGPQKAALAGKLDRSYAGSKLGEYTFPDPSGKQLDFASLKGKPVLLNIWATWCVPCVVEMPLLDQLAGDYAGRLQVITVSQDLKGKDLVPPFFAQRGFRHLQPWLDTNSDLSFDLTGGNSVLPTTILYDASGTEVWRVVGGFDWSSPAAKQAIDEALAQPPAAPATATPTSDSAA